MKNPVSNFIRVPGNGGSVTNGVPTTRIILGGQSISAFQDSDFGNNGFSSPVFTGNTASFGNSVSFDNF